MSIHKISIAEFISLSDTLSVFDVRSPGEYAHAHFPQAHSLPLFSDEERKIVGTAYKHQGKQQAIKLGLDFFGVKMKKMVEVVEEIQKTNASQSKKILVHCWRGGMRSSAVAWLLDLYGFDVYLLVGGYKAFRTWVLEQFEKTYSIKVLGGYTGSGKTEILHALKESNEKVIDLEGLANHKGSAFGGIGLEPQPSQEMFENKLALQLFINADEFWMEDESQRIGRVNIPHPLWKTIRKSPLYFIDIPFKERLKYIEKNYGKLDQQKLIEAVARIEKRLGPLETKTTINLLQENNIQEAFEILLHYYDKTYSKALYSREDVNKLLQQIKAESTDAENNKNKILHFIKEVND